MGMHFQSNSEISVHDTEHTSLRSLAPQQAGKHNIKTSLHGTTSNLHSDQKHSPWFQTKQNWHPLSLFIGSNGDEPFQVTGVYHHAHWQMVTKRIFALN
jgi:hypothetical protein